MIAITHVSKSFRSRGKLVDKSPSHQVTTALDDVSLSIGKGEIMSLLGPSGCGKTTLLRLVAGLMPIDRGAITVDAVPVTGPKRDHCMVFQHFGLLPWRSVLENVAFALELDGRSKADRYAVARRQLAIVGLESFENHFPHEISGGMQQRVGIARALTREPTLLLMDEPFAALDMQTREDMQEEFLRIWKSFRVTVLFVTHSIDEALVLSHRVAVFTPGPGKIRALVDVPFPHDSRTAGDLRAEPEFVRCRHELREMLKH